MTEFHINQPHFENNSKSICNKKQTIKNDNNLFKKYTNTRIHKQIFTVFPLTRLKQKISNSEYPFVVFIPDKDLPFNFSTKYDFIACLSCLNDVKNSEYFVFVHVINISDKFTDVLYINDAFFKISTLRFASKVSLQMVKEKTQLKRIILVISKNQLNSDEMIIKECKQYLKKLLNVHKRVVLNPGFVLHINRRLAISMEFESKYCVVDSKFLEICEFVVKVEESAVSEENDKTYCEDFYEAINESIEKDVLRTVELNLRFNNSENILIVGKKAFLCCMLSNDKQ